MTGTATYVSRESRNSAPSLHARELMIAYGGNVAVQEVTLEAPVGHITGLIGPNGAGKTTIFNACNGFVKPIKGSIELFGEDVTKATPAERARRGLGRTFQRMELCQAMSVKENVALGREARFVGNHPLRQLFPKPAERRAIATATDEALELCGLTRLANRRVAALSTGQRRLVELARALSGDFSMVLLDEPSSGLDEEETRNMATILRSVVERRGTGLLLVEHDMSLVMGVCDYIFVLDFGCLIFQGTPAEVRASDVVRRAYLGDAELDVQVGDFP